METTNTITAGLKEVFEFIDYLSTDGINLLEENQYLFDEISEIGKEIRNLKDELFEEDAEKFKELNEIRIKKAHETINNVNKPIKSKSIELGLFTFESVNFNNYSCDRNKGINIYLNSRLKRDETELLERAIIKYSNFYDKLPKNPHPYLFYMSFDCLDKLLVLLFEKFQQSFKRIDEEFMIQCDWAKNNFRPKGISKTIVSSDHAELRNEIDEVFDLEKVFGKKEKGWKRIFLSEESYNKYLDLLTLFLAGESYELPQEPINIMKGNESRIGRIMNTLWTDYRSPRDSKLDKRHDVEMYDIIRVLEPFKNKSDKKIYPSIKRERAGEA
jgi:cell division septum initiation protein DivIVA